MKHWIVISLATITLAACGSSVELNRTSGDLAYSACSEALRSMEPKFGDGEYMIVQIFDLGKRNGDLLKESLIFTYPNPAPSAGGVKPSAVCKADISAKKIIKLSYKNQDIIDNVSEELRTF